MLKGDLAQRSFHHARGHRSKASLVVETIENLLLVGPLTCVKHDIIPHALVDGHRSCNHEDDDDFSTYARSATTGHTR